MAIFPHDRTQEQTTTQGLGALALGTLPIDGYFTFAEASDALGGGNLTSVYYVTVLADVDMIEVGIGTYVRASNTFTRTTCIRSKDAAGTVSTAFLNWPAGTKTHMMTACAQALKDVTAALVSGNFGVTATGLALFLAASAAAARTALGSTTVGDAVFIAATAAAGRTALGATTIGGNIFIAADAAAERTLLGLGAAALLAVPIPIASGGTGQTTALIPAATNMLFNQAAAPVSWTQDTSQNDRVIRLVSGAGAGTGGSWTISGISVDGHELSVAELPDHAHDILTTEVSVVAGAGVVEDRIVSGSPTVRSTEAAGASQSHSHGVTIGSAWRPAYRDCIACTKN